MRNNHHHNLTNEQLEEELKKPCRICGHKSKGYHFRVVTCRACAAFFRRTIAENKVYLCRQKGVCQIRYERRNMCRACRFRKCELVGMNKEDVQLNRDAIKPPTTEEPRTDQLPSVNNPDDPSTSSSRSTVISQGPILVRAVYPQNMELLNMMLNGYRSYQSCQRSFYAMKHPENITTSADPESVTLDQYREMDKGCVTLVHQMLVDHFEPFGTFSQADRLKFLKSFYIQFTVLDQCYFSSVYFPSATDSRFYLHYKQYVESNNLLYFFANEKNPEESARFVTFLFVRTRRMINRIVQLKLSEMEIAALGGVMIWTVVTVNSTDNPTIDAKKDRIYFELHQLYVQLYGTVQAGVRFGNVLGVMMESMEIAKLCAESVALSKVFNMSKEPDDDHLWAEF